MRKTEPEKRRRRRGKKIIDDNSTNIFNIYNIVIFSVRSFIMNTRMEFKDVVLFSSNFSLIPFSLSSFVARVDFPRVAHFPLSLARPEKVGPRTLTAGTRHKLLCSSPHSTMEKVGKVASCAPSPPSHRVFQEN